jgi:hypothetical protein
MDRYIQNIHGNTIKFNVVLPDGKVLQKRFPKAAFGMDGRLVETGYTRLNDEEFILCQKEPLFRYFQKRGKLIVHETLPAEAMTPHEALVTARKENREMQANVQMLERENVRLNEVVEQLREELAASGDGVNKAPKKK